MKPLISIITVSFNSAFFLESTIKSVLIQKNASAEYLVIDGASTDDTGKILDRYREKIDLIISEPDEGIYDAMNKGISLAKGEYLIFINAGDCLCTNALKIIQDKLDSSYEIYYFAYYKVIEISGRKLQFEGPKCFTLSHEIPTCHNAMVIARDAFLRYGLYNTVYKLSADYEWLCRNRKNLKSTHCSEKVIYSLLGGVSEIDNISVLKEKAGIAKKYFGWQALGWHLWRFITVTPLSLLKRFLMAAGLFDYYLLYKDRAKGVK